MIKEALSSVLTIPEGYTGFKSQTGNKAPRTTHEHKSLSRLLLVDIVKHIYRVDRHKTEKKDDTVRRPDRDEHERLM
jgi:hypothetical protein